MGGQGKGIAVVRSARKSKGKYDYDVQHVRVGKVTHVARDYPTKAEAVRTAEGYARLAKKHPRSNSFFGK